MRKQFTPEEVDIVNAVIRVICNVFDIKDVTWIRDKKVFNKYVKKKPNPHDGAVSATTFKAFWLDEKYLLSMPFIEWLGIIIHEVAHIKYPNLSEPQVIKLAAKYTGLIE